MFPHNVKYKPFFVNICFLAFGCHHWAAAEYDERRKYGRCHDGSRKASSADVDLMARLLRAEAEGEGKQGMLLVGNVGINRVRANCSDFKGLRTIRQMVFQPHAFEAVTHGYFYQRPRESERRLARRNINGERFWPAKFSLWYFKPPGNCPQTWYGQPFVARFRSHCFYQPTGETCENVYNTF